jgi:phage baseplate assembly protein W|tara:strand:- start:28 stop:429 length:402 start_codon:yes stop_codon:yes gene_type:complete
VPLERVSRGFKDLSMSFQNNPLTNDLIALKNENAIARSIRNIVFTVPGEKFFNEDFGSEVSQLLFENVDNISALTVRDQIRQSITNFEPRVDLRTVDVSADFDNNSFDVVIIYDIIGADIPPQELQFVLQQTR